MKIPNGQVEVTQSRDIEKCRALKCTILSTNLDREDDGTIDASLSIRLPPEGLPEFVQTLGSPPARIVRHSESAEDKTVAVLDTEKRLEAKVAVRERLLALLKDASKASPGDLASIEKQLGDVQGEIESLTATQYYLNTITETVKVDISYRGITHIEGDLDFTPIDRAVHGIGRTTVESIASFVSFVAAITPWLPFVALLTYGYIRARRIWKRSAQKP